MTYLIFIFVSFIWGSNFILMKKAALAFGPISIGAGRVLGGALVLGLIWRWRKFAWPFRRSDWLPMLILVVMAYAWPFSVLPALVAQHGSAFMGMMISLVPLLTILVSIPMLGVYPSPRQVIGVTGGLVCLGIMMRDGLDRQIPPGDLILAVSVPLCYAVANTHIKRRFSGIPTVALTCSALGLASVVLVPLGCFLPSEELVINEHFPLAAGALTLSSLLATGVAMFLFYKLIQEQGPLFAGMTAYLIPLGALIWGWVDREKVTGMQLIALLGTLAMVAVTQYGAASRLREMADAAEGQSESDKP